MSTVSIFLLILLAYPFIQNLTTLLHELGHALPALWLTDTKRVEVYINAYGEKEGALRFRAGRLFLYWHPFRIRGYGCGLTVYQAPKRYIWSYVITVGGVVFSLLIAGLLLVVVPYHQLSEVWEILVIVLFAGTVVDLFVNLFPSDKGIPLDNGEMVPNDGKKLYHLWRNHRVAITVEKVMHFAAQKQYTAAKETLQAMPLEEADAEELRILLHTTAGTGVLAEEALWDEAFKRLQRLDTLGFLDWLNWGVIIGRRGQYARALACFDKEMPPLPEDEWLCLANRAFLLLEMGEPAAADPLFEQLVAHEATPYNLAHYGVCLAMRGQQQLGWEQLEKALTLDGQHPYVLRCAGLYHLHLGQKEQALAYLQRISEAHERIPRLSALIQSAKQSEDS